MRRLLIYLITTVSITASASTFDVAIGPERPVSSPPSVTPAPYEQHLAGLASNGRNFLAIWLDRRATVPSLPYVYGGVPLYVSRLDGAGRSLNSFGLKLRNLAVSAALVFTSAGYMALWSENGQTYSMFLDDDGAPTSVPKRLADGYLIGATSNGRTIFVIHGPFSEQQFASVFNMDGALLSRTSLDPANRYPVRQNRLSVRPMVMPNGDYGFVAETWHCPGNVGCAVTATLTTISESGGVTTRALGPLSQRSQSAAAIGNGRLMLVWMSDNNTSPARSLAFRIFDTAGNPLNDQTTLAATNDVQTISGVFAPSIGWDGHEFLVAWQWPFANEQSGEIHAVRITTDGFVIDGSPMILSPTLGNPPQFASSGTSQLVAWDSLWDWFTNRTSNINIRSTPTFDTLAYDATTIIPESAALQTQVQLATVGSNTLAVWREGDASPAIVGALFNQATIPISPAGSLDQQTPAVGASRDLYLVVWREQAFEWNAQQSLRILGRRLSSNGIVLDRNPIVIAEEPGLFFIPAANTLSVGSNGTDFLVVWPSSADLLRGARVSSTGVVLDSTPIEMSRPPNGTPGSPRVVWNGSQYAVVWTADPSCKACLISPPGPPVSQIFVAHVTQSGKLSDSQMIWKGGYGSRVALARGQTGLMLAWGISADAASKEACVYTMPLRDDGAPAGSIHAVACTMWSGWPLQFPDLDVAWDGASFVVAWTQVASSATVARAIRVSGDGTAFDGAPFDVAPVGSASFQPALASSVGGVVVAYDRIASEPQYGGVARVFARPLDRLSWPPRKRAARE